MAEHYAFRCAGGSGSVDERGDVIRLDFMRLLIKERIGFRGGMIQDGPDGYDVDLRHVIHDHDFFQAGLGLNGLHFAQLFQRKALLRGTRGSGGCGGGFGITGHFCQDVAGDEAEHGYARDGDDACRGGSRGEGPRGPLR